MGSEVMKVTICAGSSVIARNGIKTCAPTMIGNTVAVALSVSRITERIFDQLSERRSEATTKVGKAPTAEASTGVKMTCRQWSPRQYR